MFVLLGAYGLCCGGCSDNILCQPNMSMQQEQWWDHRFPPTQIMQFTAAGLAQDHVIVFIDFVTITKRKVCSHPFDNDVKFSIFRMERVDKFN